MTRFFPFKAGPSVHIGLKWFESDRRTTVQKYRSPIFLRVKIKITNILPYRRLKKKKKSTSNLNFPRMIDLKYEKSVDFLRPTIFRMSEKKVI